MSGYKQRGFPKRKNERNSADVPENASPTVLLFKTYQIELDAKHDKYERLIKKSRDLTIESKRIIFLLHRVIGSGSNENTLVEARQRLAVLMTTVIRDIGIELGKPEEVHQFIRAFTNGLQEFVEAVSFYYYLKNGTVITLEELYNLDLLEESPKPPEEQIEKKPELPLSAFLTPVEYVLGIADLTGELMRKCINSVGSGDIEEPFKLNLLLQNIYQALLMCSNYSKDLKRKLFTLKSSVQKVENACYAIKIRGTETPGHMFSDFFSTEDEFKDSEACEF